MSSAVDSCFVRDFVAHIPGLRGSALSGGDLLSRLRVSVTAVLNLAEDLPRDHWVWRPGYADSHVNMARLTDYLAYQERHEPLDEDCLWARVLVDLVTERGWGLPYLRTLHSIRSLPAAWPIYCALFSQQTWAPPIPLGLSRVLREFNLAMEAAPFIRAILDGADSYVDLHEGEGFTRAWGATALRVALEDPAA